MRLLPSLLFALLATSCSVQATLTLNPGATQVDASFALSTAARGAWTSLRELDSTLPADPFDPAVLRGLGDHTVVTATPQGATVSFVADSAQGVLPEVKAGTWEWVLDRTTVRRMANLTLWAGSPALDSLLPSPGAKITEADYRDLLAYLLGPATPEAAAKVLVDQSTVQLTVVAPRPILLAVGAVSVDGRQAVYRWPLVKVLTLETPLRLSLKF